MYLVHIFGPDGRIVSQVAGQVLALWELGPTSEAASVVTVGFDALSARPRLVDARGYQTSVQVCTDGTGAFSIDAPLSDLTPFEWLFSEALPELLPVRLVDELRRQYKLRNAARNRAAYIPKRGKETQERLF